MKNSLEKSNEEMKERNNELLIQRDLLENEFKSQLEYEKNTNALLINRLNEAEGKPTCTSWNGAIGQFGSILPFASASLKMLTLENNRIRDKENFTLNEVSKFQAMLSNLEKEKANLEYQLKSLDQNIKQKDIFLGNLPDIDLESAAVASGEHGGSSSDLINGECWSSC